MSHDESPNEDEEEIARNIAGYEPQDARKSRGDPFQPDIEPESPDPSNISLADAMGTDSPIASDDQPPDEPDSRRSDDDYLPLESAAIPFAQLDALSHDERRRFARKNGAKVPSTDDVRDDLHDAIHNVIRHEDKRVIPGPTGSGKTYTVASTRWGARDDLTDGRQLYHFLPTRDARDEAVEVAEENNVSHEVLRGRDEACPICAGDYDPQPEGENSGLSLTVDGEPASEWIERMCGNNGIPLSDVHDRLGRVNDQGHDLPCMDDGACEAVDQWRRVRENEPSLVIATHQFAHAPGTRMNTNIVIDEEPSFTMDMTSERVRAAVSSYLEAANAMVDTWEDFWRVSTADNPGRALAEIISDDGDIGMDARKRGLAKNEYFDALEKDLKEDLRHRPDREWFYTAPGAHTAARGLAKAVFNSEEQAGGRRAGSYFYEPLRPDARMKNDDGYNREYIKIVFDSTNDVSRIWSIPDFSQARSIVGLDAHPSMPVWKLQTHPDIAKKSILSTAERKLWRRYERGLRVVQTGEATRPLASGNYFNQDKANVLVEALSNEYGRDFKTAVTASSVERDLHDIMGHHGVYEPELMHYGEEKSRNDFADENIGLVYGSIDPGDGLVMDIVAAHGYDAVPERSEACCKHCGDREEAPDEPGDGCHKCNHTGLARETGRNFEGEDADKAEAILASVRENHVAQAAGRYARNADDPDDSATVFVATDATPEGFVDTVVPGTIKTFTRKQRSIVSYTAEQESPVTAHEVSMHADVSERYARKVLNDLVDRGQVESNPRQGTNGRTIYAATGLTEHGLADLGGSHETRNDDVQGLHYTWSFRVAHPNAPPLLPSDEDDTESDGDVDASDDSGGKSGPIDT